MNDQAETLRTLLKFKKGENLLSEIPTLNLIGDPEFLRVLAQGLARRQLCVGLEESDRREKFCIPDFENALKNAIPVPQLYIKSNQFPNETCETPFASLVVLDAENSYENFQGLTVGIKHASSASIGVIVKSVTVAQEARKIFDDFCENIEFNARYLGYLPRSRRGFLLNWRSSAAASDACRELVFKQVSEWLKDVWGDSALEGTDPLSRAIEVRRYKGDE